MRFALILAALLCAPGIIAYAEIQQDVVERDTIGGTGGGGGGDLSSTDIDTFAELDAIVADEGLVNLNDAQTLLNKVIDGNSNTVKMLRHATDCTAYTGAVDGQYCWEQDTDTLYVCETEDECDTAGEWDAIASGGGAVDSVFGRTGTVTAATSDYDANQIDNTPAGTVEATDVQAAINELDTDKLSTTSASSTYFPIAGGLFSGDVTLHAQSLTIADSGDGNPATDSATTITGNDLYVTCSDADGCELTLSEADPIHNRGVRVWNISANALTLVHSAGVAEMCGGADIVLAQKESANFQYVTDEWNQLCTQTSWADLYGVPAFRKTLIQLRPQANEPPATAFATMNQRNSHPTLRFNGNVCAIWSFVMPNTYGGNGVTVDIFHISTETTNDVDWDVSMELVGTSQDVDSDSFATAVSGDGNANNATSGIPTLTSVSLTSGAQMDSCVADALCRVRICRDDTGDSGGADTIDYLGGQLRETP
jgi:hypothetical protein